MTGAPAADAAEGEDGVASRTIHLFKERDLGAQIMRGDGGDEARGAGAEKDHVVASVSFLRSGDGGGCHARAGDAGSRTQKAGLQKTTAGNGLLGHELILHYVGVPPTLEALDRNLAISVPT